jgi:four helix bundle protein
MINSYRDLIVWQKSKDLVIEIYKITSFFPREEVYGLTSQMRRCSISIPSNIAEGRYRGTKRDFVQFLRIAFGSGAELETQIIIAKEIYNKSGVDFSKAERLLEEVMKMLNVMIRNINPKS